MLVGMLALGYFFADHSTSKYLQLNRSLPIHYGAPSVQNSAPSLQNSAPSAQRNSSGQDLPRTPASDVRPQ
jgi:hypothetical protein